MKSNDQEFLVEQIRTKYTEKEHTDLDRLKELDKKAMLPAKIFAISFGVIAILIFGTGMCFAMGVIGESRTVGVIVGVVGLCLCGLNYVLYEVILEKSKKKYAPEILRLSEELLKR